MAEFEHVLWRFDNQPDDTYHKAFHYTLEYLITGLKHNALINMKHSSAINNAITDFLGDVFIRFINKKCIDKIKQMDNYIDSMKQKIKEKKNMTYNLLMTYDLGIISISYPQSMYQYHNDSQLTEFDQYMGKAYGLASRTCLENFELNEMIQELKDENNRLEKGLSEFKAKVNKYIFTMDDVDRNDKEILLWRKKRYQQELNNNVNDYKITDANSYDEVICNQQLKYMQDVVASLKSLIIDTEHIASNLKMRFESKEIIQDEFRKNGNILFDDMNKEQKEELTRKCEAVAQRTILDNFEQREVVNEHRDENYYLRNDKYKMKEMVTTIYGYMREYQVLLQKDNNRYNDIPRLLNPLVLYYYYKINLFEFDIICK